MFNPQAPKMATICHLRQYLLQFCNYFGQGMGTRRKPELFGIVGNYPLSLRFFVTNRYCNSSRAWATLVRLVVNLGLLLNHFHPFGDQNKNAFDKIRLTFVTEYIQ